MELFLTNGNSINEKIYLAFAILMLILGIFMANINIFALFKRYKNFSKYTPLQKFIIAFMKDIIGLIIIPISIEIFNGNFWIIVIFVLTLIIYFIVFSMDYQINNTDIVKKTSNKFIDISNFITLLLTIVVFLLALIGLAYLLWILY